MESSRSPVAVADVPIKRPPEDEEPFDPRRAPPKRQTIQPPVANGQSNPFNAPSSEAIDHQLIGKTPGELITIILSMRSSHEQQISELQNRYEAVSRQLEQLTHALNGHFASQIAALQSVQQVGLFGIRETWAMLTKCHHRVLPPSQPRTRPDLSLPQLPQFPMPQTGTLRLHQRIRLSRLRDKRPCPRPWPSHRLHLPQTT